jgi:hypothetical protein
MGKEIYSSNDQLGGPMIMFPNGVRYVTLVDCVYPDEGDGNYWVFVCSLRCSIDNDLLFGSHCLVDNHLDGMVTALTWLSFVPAVR